MHAKVLLHVCIDTCQVLYGDTDSMFVRLPGRSKDCNVDYVYFKLECVVCKDEAFTEGARIAKEARSMYSLGQLLMYCDSFLARLVR